MIYLLILERRSRYSNNDRHTTLKPPAWYGIGSSHGATKTTLTCRDVDRGALTFTCGNDLKSLHATDGIFRHLLPSIDPPLVRYSVYWSFHCYTLGGAVAYCVL